MSERPGEDEGVCTKMPVEEKKVLRKRMGNEESLTIKKKSKCTLTGRERSLKARRKWDLF